MIALQVPAHNAFGDNTTPSKLRTRLNTSNHFCEIQCKL
ncbi:hypothetical protein PRUB_b0914 [Pseudoalteromonas rubra]|uniref:Uncharacterized protein n=1 Tax=Pseudoalteromonas rubra TaxID=43658 RepID=A0A8T0C2S7_9GAMM|nr:hypothetical protein PRUB_b0914 [Pseudoalteromonas rubra]